jgi:catechol 2,3-dioxygenase-like lactoylglutathione lyase family enzyme
MSDSNKFHISLYVENIARSVEFYGRLFGQEPAKMFPDYAKFELDDPGVVLSLEKQQSENLSKLSHLGIRLESKNALIDWSSKVAERGLDFQHLDNVACCYADQSKIYMNDPDGVLFEIYNVNRDLEPEQIANPAVANTTGSDSISSYDHVLPSEFPEELAFATSSLQTVSLRGTLNAKLGNDAIYSILRESSRVLKPGGEVILHMLVSDKEPKEDIPSLPEPASYVRRIPAEKFVWDSLREAGFVGVKAERFSASHVFEFKGSKFRELLIKGSKPGSPGGTGYSCIFVGPFPSVEIEDGQQFKRGQRYKVSADTFATLSSATYKDMFVVLNDDGSSCGN